MMIKKLLTLIVCLMMVSGAEARQWECFSTTKDASWTKQKIKSGKPSGKPDVMLDREAKAQKITGIGGCFNEMGWDALQILPQEKQQEIMQAIFGKDGARFDYCRMPLGANDFSMSFYSYDDVADDYHLVNFNITRDRYILIPYIKAAKAINPSLRIWASPWCPPAWMKTNNHYASYPHPDTNGLPSEKVISDVATGFKMQEGYLRTYADYFVKFVKAYAGEGLEISAVCPQNEPCSNQVFPSCKWRSEDLTHFVGRYLGPAFEKAGLPTDIVFGTVNNSDPAYAKTALENSEAARYIKGVGFQWDGKNAIPHIHRDYPEMMLMQTETECGDGANTWEYAEYTWNLMKHYFMNGINSYHYWNMILPVPGISPWGWNQNSLVSVDRQSGAVTYNPEYYLMKHLSHYVSTGAYLLKTPADRDMLAFVNPDGSMAVVMANTSDTEQAVSLLIDKDDSVTATLQPHSFSTIFVK